LTCSWRTRLNESHEMLLNASGLTNSVARTSPKRSTTVSQMTDESSQWRAPRSGNDDARAAQGRAGDGQDQQGGHVRWQPVA
jgi:hypothetical protein